jgi:type I restriction-modification system DNA methylase subunit
LYNDYADIEDVARVVSLSEVRQNGYKLNINRYAKGVGSQLDSSWKEFSIEELVDSVIEQSLPLHTSIENFIDSLNK